MSPNPHDDDITATRPAAPGQTGWQLWAGSMAAVALVLAGLWWWLQTPTPHARPPAEAAAPSAAPSAAPPVAAAPAIKHPIEPAPAADEEAAAVATPTLAGSVGDLAGKAALALIQTDDFPQRIVATVDNLGRAAAPARLWPLVPAAGRFSTNRQGDSETIAADNPVRYERYVAVMERLEPGRLAAIYRRFHPQLQQAYVDLGYPRGYFNDRVVEVIDLMLATPEAPQPVAVRMPTVNAPVQPPRPWVLYEYEDPKLQALPAGQRLLLRMSPDQQRRVKMWLTDFRRRVATG